MKLAKRIVAKILRLGNLLEAWQDRELIDKSFTVEHIKENAKKYGYFECKSGNRVVQVPLENEFGKCYPTYAKETIDTLFNIRKSDLVVDIGGGNGPLKRANIVVDLFPQETPHRNEPLKLYPHQKFIQANIEDLHGHFKDKTVDFLFTSQTLEHVERPEKACAEIIRVAKRGFLDMPRITSEMHMGHHEHRWYIDYIDKVLVFRRKPVSTVVSPSFGPYALNAYHFDPEIALMIEYFYRNVSCVQLLWENSFDYKVLDWK